MYRHAFVFTLCVALLCANVANAYTAKQINGKWRNICAPCNIPGAPLPFDQCITDVIFISATKSYTELVSCSYFGSTIMARKWGKYTVVGRRIARTLQGYSPTTDPVTGGNLSPPPAGQYDILTLTANSMNIRDLLSGYALTMNRVM
jgi:hypothetical protein